MTDFFKQINYSASNEDGQTEREALSSQLFNKSVLTITGSGSRALELALASPEHITSIDFNPTQNFLLELKMAAIKELDYQDFIEFIGLRPNLNRLKTYTKIKTNLSSEAQAFWDSKTYKIQKGILYCGTWETYLKKISKAAQFIRKKQIDELLNFKDLKAQSEFWNKTWDNRSWKIFMQILGQRFLWKYVIREPGIHLVPQDLSISKTIKDRFDSAAHNVLFKEAAFSWLILKGEYQCQNQEGLPCHLQKTNFKILKTSLDKIKLKTQSLDEFLNSENEKFHAFSVSDFGSYASKNTYESIWQGLKKSAHPEAKVCEREFLVPHSPEQIPGLNLKRDLQLEKDLNQKDKSFIYKFIIARFH